MAGRKLKSLDLTDYFKAISGLDVREREAIYSALGKHLKNSLPYDLKPETMGSPPVLVRGGREVAIISSGEHKIFLQDPKDYGTFEQEVLKFKEKWPQVLQELNSSKEKTDRLAGSEHIVPYSTIPSHRKPRG
jgi:hypothetical protein